MTKSTKAVMSNNWDAKRIGTSEYAINPNDLVDMIITHTSKRIRENVEGFLAMGVFCGHVVTRIELEYSNYIQMQRIEEKHGGGVYKLTFDSRDQKAFILFADQETVLGIIQSINNPAFFKKWKKKLASDDFGGYQLSECEPYDFNISTMGVGLI